MDRELTPDELAELLPAYALDAVDDDERAQIEDYLARNDDARARVAEFQVTASMLAHTGGPPPVGVWEKLESIIAESPRTLRAVAPPDVVGPRPAPTPPAEHGSRLTRYVGASPA